MAKRISFLRNGHPDMDSFHCHSRFYPPLNSNLIKIYHDIFFYTSGREFTKATSNLSVHQKYRISTERFLLRFVGFFIYGKSNDVVYIVFVVMALYVHDAFLSIVFLSQNKFLDIFYLALFGYYWIQSVWRLALRSRAQLLQICL